MRYLSAPLPRWVAMTVLVLTLMLLALVRFVR